MIVLALLACTHKVQPGDVPAEVQRWAPPPRVVEYDRVNLAGEIPLPDNRIREVWEGPQLLGNDLVYDVTSFDVTKDPAEPLRLDRTRVFYGPEGMGFLGTVAEDGAFTPWEPRQIVLPPAARVGDTWTATHTKGASTSERSCEIFASNYCEGGLVVVCESQRDGGRIVLRDHFCQGYGWGGFEALVLAGQQPSVRMWSAHIVRDGQQLTGVDDG